MLKESLGFNLLNQFMPFLDVIIIPFDFNEFIILLIMKLKDTLIASLVPIFLGFGFVIAKPAFESFPPILLMGIRFTFAALLLIWWFPIPKGYLKKIFFA